jgi:hypothetical protein
VAAWNRLSEAEKAARSSADIEEKKKRTRQLNGTLQADVAKKRQATFKRNGTKLSNSGDRYRLAYRLNFPTRDEERNMAGWVPVAEQPRPGGHRLKSSYNGVGWAKKAKRWQARIKPPGAPVQHLGGFSTEEEAARAYDDAARQLRERLQVSERAP